MTNNTITVMKKELARFFGDRRLVITTLLLPGIMIYVVYSFLGSVMMKTMLPEDTYVAKASVVDMPDSVREEMRELRVDWQQADREQLTEIRQEIQEKQVDGLVVFPADFDTVVENYQVSSGESAPNVEIYYNSAEPESAHFYNEVSEVLEQYETSLANKLDINAGDSVYYDCATSKDTTGQMFSMMMPLLLMMFLYSGCMSVAPESIAGEKERGTIATLLVTPMKRSSLALGKVFSLSIIALLAGCSSFIGTFAGIAKNDGRRTDWRGFLGVRTYGLCDAASDHSVNGNGAGIHDRTGLRFCQKCERGSYNSVSVYHCGDIYRIEPHAQSGKGDPAIPVSDPGIQQCAVHERHFFL